MRCNACGTAYSLVTDGFPWRCARCTGLLELAQPVRYDASAIDPTQPGLWRYRQLFPFDPALRPVTLGEGNTPLVRVDVDDYDVHFKVDYLNPTSSYKDRGATVLASLLRHYGVTEAVEDSSGNAGAAFAAYAARAGINATIYVPGQIAPGKLRQIAVFGAKTAQVAGPRSAAAEAVQQAAQGGAVYASHNYNPLGMYGLATSAFEIVEALGEAPEFVIVPTGHAGNLVALHHGFRAMLAAGVIDRLPRMIGVQPEACAPLWAVFNLGPDAAGFVTEGETLAEGIRALQPVRGDAALQAVAESNGYFVPVTEIQIEAGRNVLARMGFYVEYTTAVVWAALRQVLREEKPLGPTVVILTGSGLKQV